MREGYDLGIRCGNIMEEGMVAREILPAMRDFLLVSESYAERHGIPQTPADLVHHKMIGYRMISANRIQPLLVQQDGRQVEVKMPISLREMTCKTLCNSFNPHYKVKLAMHRHLWC